ncbi:hypothetical protein J4460_08210 [Candidatus Woesearchaeota archaeon]|nr:hypothetical protein [Candidatus Woesearchaeota archaeon]HIH39075.1 hypothetical protein [Candidatus Woesearchaeota archaeon]HIJ03147.1 hypothetical protein [Candidatus Woesearchaeota archaeon]
MKIYSLFTRDISQSFHDMQATPALAVGGGNTTLRLQPSGCYAQQCLGAVGNK